MGSTVETCPACGGSMKSSCSVGSVLVCCQCGGISNYSLALEVVRHKHHNRLEKILAELNTEVSAMPAKN